MCIIALTFLYNLIFFRSKILQTTLSCPYWIMLIIKSDMWSYTLNDYIDWVDCHTHSRGHAGLSQVRKQASSQLLSGFELKTDGQSYDLCKITSKQCLCAEDMSTWTTRTLMTISWLCIGGHGAQTGKGNSKGEGTDIGFMNCMRADNSMASIIVLW